MTFLLLLEKQMLRFHFPLSNIAFFRPCLREAGMRGRRGGEKKSEFHSRSGTGSGPTWSFPTTNIPRIPGNVCVCVRELVTIRWATMEERGKKAYDGGNQIKPPCLNNGITKARASMPFFPCGSSRHDNDWGGGGGGKGTKPRKYRLIKNQFPTTEICVLFRLPLQRC